MDGFKKPNNEGINRMNNAIKGFMVIGLLAMLETAYASRPVIIQTPTGTTVCYIHNDGRYIYCEPL